MENEELEERRANAEGRLEILEALVLATRRRTELLKVVGEAEESEDAERAVRDLLGIDEIPAKAVLDAQLRRFTAGQRANLISARDEVREQLDELK